MDVPCYNLIMVYSEDGWLNACKAEVEMER
jgi:hypothetical protein